ncbi:type I-E CRISPR-associated protein Cas5/CasD [Rhodococcus marinonascens]|uniref:type I-E CRISPR-associated protein Cas5/CasD n=1 Tax=Rhodococcus marinonascens TaxID=38311 RepID=UPI000934A09E|nr:type I-E CRISPR-associated protein Cas5/CasD [Rhodococcus marinonascens]
MTTATVTFRLAGPQQAWSARERRAHRPTQDHPTKSGIVGLVANALGRDRTGDISDLTALRLGVRADRPGNIESDYHTSGSGRFPLLPAEVLADPALARAAAKGLPTERTYAAPKNIRRDSKDILVGKREAAILTTDEYLVDAVFTIALTGARGLVDAIAAALTAPARSLHLGRKAYPLSAPPAPVVHPVADPADALALVPPAEVASRYTTWIEETPVRSHPAADTQITVDQPTRFDQRRNTPRLESRRTTAAVPHPPTGTRTVDFFAPEEHP